MNFRNSFTFIKIYIVLLFFISNIISAQSDSTLIINMYDDFQTTVKSKDVTGHSNLLLTPFMPVNIINKSPQGPTINYINAQSWISFFSQPRPYELVISDIDVKLENNIAITIANFKEYINENYSAFGTDVFSYVKTNDGWKYNTFNNTVVLSSDQNDYEEAFTFNNKPEDIPDLFTASINQKNRTNFTNLFTSNFAHFISVDGTLNESFSTAKHSANAFINSVINNSSNIEFELNNYKIEIHDQYVASIIGDYSIKENNELSESGRIILVLNASRAANWKINVVLKSPGSSVTAVDDKSEIVENSFKLEQNYPNPFNPSTTFSYTINETSRITLKVYDLLGREISTLVNKNLTPGVYETNWNAEKMASGIYIVKLDQIANGNITSQSIKVNLLK